MLGCFCEVKMVSGCTQKQNEEMLQLSIYIMGDMLPDLSASR
jgi:hypothetical protein